MSGDCAYIGRDGKPRVEIVFGNTAHVLTLDEWRSVQLRVGCAIAALPLHGERTVESCRHCGAEWICPDCDGVGNGQSAVPETVEQPPERER